MRMLLSLSTRCYVYVSPLRFLRSILLRHKPPRAGGFSHHLCFANSYLSAHLQRVWLVCPYTGRSSTTGSSGSNAEQRMREIDFFDIAETRRIRRHVGMYRHACHDKEHRCCYSNGTARCHPTRKQTPGPSARGCYVRPSQGHTATLSDGPNSNTPLRQASYSTRWVPFLGGRFHGHAPLVARRHSTPSAPNKTRSEIYVQRPQTPPPASISQQPRLPLLDARSCKYAAPPPCARDLYKSRPSADKGFEVRHKPTDSGTSAPGNIGLAARYVCFGW